MNISLIQAIYALNPNIVTIHDDVAYDANNNIVHYDATAAQALVANNVYKVSRSQEYPTIGDQLDMLWHAIDSGGLNQTSDFYTKLKAVKTQFPKP